MTNFQKEVRAAHYMKMFEKVLNKHESDTYLRLVQQGMTLHKLLPVGSNISDAKNWTTKNGDPVPFGETLTLVSFITGVHKISEAVVEHAEKLGVSRGVLRRFIKMSLVSTALGLHVVSEPRSQVIGQAIDSRLW